MTQERQDQFYEELEQLTGEQVLQAFTNWHGMRLLTDEFLEFCMEEGYIFFNDEEEQLIGSLCDDIAMQYDGNPNAEDIQCTIARYEWLYDASVSNEIVSEIYRRFDVTEIYH
jgi:hypothetical protein